MPRLGANELAAWCDGQWQGTPPEDLAGVCQDTRAIGPRELYVALAGERFDGHRFVAQAFEKGAGAALVNRDNPVCGEDYPMLVVKDTRTALLSLGTAYRRRVAPRIVGVTGSVGKTTVKEMIAAVLGARWRTARTAGNWNNDVGLPLSLLRMEPYTEMGVFEIGMNHPGEIAELSGVLLPDWGVVTAIGAAHIGFFSSVDDIAAEKAALLESLPMTGRAFIDAGGAYAEFLAGKSPAQVVTVSLAGKADYVCISHDPAANRAVVREARTGEERIFSLPGPGRHTVLNALFAIAVGRESGMSWENIRTGLAVYQPMPLRWERQEAGGVIVINDAYNANPVSMRAAIDTFGRMPCSGARWLVLGDMKELGDFEEEEHRRLGWDIASGPWAGLLLVGAVAEGIGVGAIEAGYPSGRVRHFASAPESAAFLSEAVTLGDMVLLKASRSVRLEQVVALLDSTSEVEI